MKKTIIKLLILLFVLSFSISTLTACDDAFYEKLDELLKEFETLDLPSDYDGDIPGENPVNTNPGYGDNRSEEDSAEKETAMPPIETDREVNLTTESATEIVPDEPETESINPDVPDTERKNYDSTFYLGIVTDGNPIDFYWTEHEGKSDLSKAIFERQQMIMSHIGVEIIGLSAGNQQSYVEVFKVAVKNKEGTIDTLISHASSGLASLVSEMYLSEFNSFPGIDLNKSYWNTDLMDHLAIPVSGENHYFLGFGDLNAPNTHVIIYNKDLANQCRSFGSDDVDQLVHDGLWTFEKMCQASQNTYTDLGGNGKDLEDIFGISGQQWLPWIGFLQASDINIVNVDHSGSASISFISENIDKTYHLIDRLQALVNSNHTYFDVIENGIVPECSVPLSTGRVLMQLENTYRVKDLVGSDVNFGILPYPKFEEDQAEYRSLQWGGYICIPAYVNDKNMTGDTLELLCAYSTEVNREFFEEMLGRELSDNSHEAATVEIIKDSLSADFGLAFSEKSEDLAYALIYATHPGEEGKPLKSQYSDATINAISRRISTFVKGIAKNIPVNTPDDNQPEVNDPDNTVSPDDGSETDRFEPDNSPDEEIATETCEESFIGER